MSTQEQTEYNNAYDDLCRIRELIVHFKIVKGYSDKQIQEVHSYLLAWENEAYQYVKESLPGLFKSGLAIKKNLPDEGLGNYKSEISFEQALDELHDAAHEHEVHPTRESKRRMDEAEKNLAKAKIDFAGENIRNLRDGRKGIDADPAKWKKYWLAITRGKTHKKSALVKALKKTHAKISNPMAFAKALEERFG